MTAQITKLNEDITKFPQVFPITDDMTTTFDGVSRLIMLDRYAFKDTAKTTLSVGDIVVLTVKTDPKFPARGVGHITEIKAGKVTVKLEEQYAEHADNEAGTLTRPIEAIDKPLELYYEQIAKRNAHGLSAKEADDVRDKVESEFYEILASLDFIPGGRVIYGAGSETDVTFFNCYVMPYPKDSREGIGEHRNEVMEIMSRGGGRLTFS